MNCLPPRLVRPLIWVLSAIFALGDHYGHWLTSGDASVKLRPVNKRHGVLAKVAFFPVAVALFAGFLGLGLALRIPPLVALSFLLVVIVPTTIGLFVVADAWNRARLFRHHIDYVSLELVRHHRSPKGSGAESRDAIHQYAADSGSIVGGWPEPPTCVTPSTSAPSAADTQIATTPTGCATTPTIADERSSNHEGQLTPAALQSTRLPIGEVVRVTNAINPSALPTAGHNSQ